MASKKDDCTRGKFAQKLDAKYGYYVKDCKDKRERRVLAFLVPILSPEKPYNVTLTLATTILLSFSGERVVDWGSIIGEVVHKLATATKRGQPSYIGPFLYHLYEHGNLLTEEETVQWAGHQIMRELQTTDSEPDLGPDESKEEEVIEVSTEEQPAAKKRKTTEGTPATRTRSATRVVEAGTDSQPRGEVSLDAIIRDLEGVRDRWRANEVQLQQLGAIVGNPPRDTLVTAVREAVQDPRHQRKLEGKVDQLTAENRKVLEKLAKVEAEKKELQKQMREAASVTRKVMDTVGVPGDVWLKAKMFDADLKNAGHVSGTKLVPFVMDQGSKMDAALRAMRTLVATLDQLFPSSDESSDDEETSSSSAEKTPGGTRAEAETEAAGEEEYITDITAPDPVSAPVTVDLNSTPAISAGDKETLRSGHVAEASPASPSVTFQVVSRNPPPLFSEKEQVTPATQPRGPRQPEVSQLAAPLVPDSSKFEERATKIHGPLGLNVLVDSPLSSVAVKDKVKSGSRRRKRPSCGRRWVVLRS